MLTIIYALYFFILGLIIGSFLNVVILRFNTGKTLSGRSMCFSCGKTLRWFELAPLFSFLWQRGMCRSCKTKISWQYPIVELSTGLLFVFIYFQNLTMIGTLLFMAMFGILVVITVYDLRHKIIPDSLVFIFAGLALMSVFERYSFNSIVFAYPNFLDLLAGPLLFTPFFILWFVSRGRWIGLGDGKLALGIGWALGLTGGVSAIILSFWIGAVVSIGLLVYNNFYLGTKKITMKTEIPFAPFMVVALIIVFLFHFDILGLSQILFL